MHMNIRHYRVPPAQVEEVVRRVDDLWVEKIRRMKGFVSYHVVRDAEDRLTSMSAFVDEADARAAGEASAEWVGAALLDMDIEFLEQWEGPVVVHAGGG
jgi:quinol monooxygenase YgiN